MLNCSSSCATLSATRFFTQVCVSADASLAGKREDKDEHQHDSTQHSTLSVYNSNENESVHHTTRTPAPPVLRLDMGYSTWVVI
jgi:hypothetical protein